MEKVAMMEHSWEKARKFSVCRFWGSGSFAHVCFESSGCRFRKMRHCIMCDYGAGENISARQAVDSLSRLLSAWPEPITRLLLGTCGSILDPEEMSAGVLDAILQVLASAPPQHILFETHYTTITPEILSKLRSALPHKHLSIEMGLESADEAVLQKSLRKYLKLSDLEKVIAQIQSFDISVVLNVFLGAPFLDSLRQAEDSRNAIRWAFAHGAEQVVIFPANVKPGTLLWALYEKGQYEPISHWLLIELLRSLEDDELPKIALSWYGDRQDRGLDTDILPPRSCKRCYPALMAFYKKFMEDFSATSRRELLNSLHPPQCCTCYSFAGSEQRRRELMDG